MSIKSKVIAAGFSLFRAAGLHRLAGESLRGRGVILTFHRVRPASGEQFAPNALLEITPEFFDAALTRLRGKGLEIVTLDEAVRRLVTGEGSAFAVLTFDDGFRDVAEHALPVLRRHGAPFMNYIAPGLASRQARLWWVELEEAIRRLDHVEMGAQLSLPARDDAEKTIAFNKVYWALRARGERALLDGVALLRDQAGVPRGPIEQLCLDWDGLQQLATCELADFGAHSMTHARLRQIPEAEARAEMADSRRVLEAELARPCPHFAYPIGDPTSAGPSEFALARELGFATAVTTRPGMIFPQHAAHLHALPRLSVNGLWQDLDYLDILLSGAPFAVWNRGRRLNVG